MTTKYTINAAGKLRRALQLDGELVAAVFVVVMLAWLAWGMFGNHAYHYDPAQYVRGWKVR